MSDAGCDDGCDELFFPVDRIMFETLVFTLAAGCTGLLICLYFWRRGQFEDCEDVKYQMFRDEECD